MRRTNDINRDEILGQAARWVARLASDDLSASDRAAFQEWLAHDPGNARAYSEAQQTWSDLDALAGLASTDPLALPVPLRAEIEHCGAMVNATVSGSWRPAGVRRVAALAAGVVVAVLGIAWMSRSWWHAPLEPQTLASELKTRVGERRQTMLADGSLVWLNTDTDLQVAFSASRRSVHLVSGEAYFEVAKDSRRPFVVGVGDSTITAVGTTFNVYHRGDQTRVTVLEGTVEVARGEPAVGKAALRAKSAAPRLRKAVIAPAIVETPEKVRVDQTAALLDTGIKVTTLPPQAVAHEASWRQGKLYFDAVTLKDMVTQLNPYLSAHVVIADPSIEGFVGGGVVHVDSADSILTAISVAWPVEVKREAPDLIVLTRRR
jgi:transmembrane sensor